MHTLVDQACLGVLFTLVGVAAVSDMRTGLIPNSLVACGAVAAVLAQLLAVVMGHMTWGAALWQLGLGFAAGALVPLVLYSLGALGGGDVKLFAAIGLCVGPLPVLGIMFWSHLFALFFVPFHWLRHGNLRSSLRTSGRIFLNLFLPRARRKPIERSSLTALRFAPAIFLAALWVCVFGEALP